MGKYGNVRVSLDGYSFGSKLEASVYQLLKLRLHSDEIVSIQPQDHLVICGPPGHRCKRPIKYVADFRCERPDGTSFWVEAKGRVDAVWSLKKNLYLHHGPGILEIWVGHHLKPFLQEIIAPIGMPLCP